MNKAGRKAGRNGAVNPIRVVSTFFMGQKKNLTIVEVAGDYLLLGITGSSITYLTKLENPDTIENLKRLGDARRMPFLNIFNG
jgi:flagellar biogenesis protein FliO